MTTLASFSPETRCWRAAGPPPLAGPAFLWDRDDLPADLSQAVILPSGGEARARALAARGAQQILLADAALADSDVVSRLALALGNRRLGVWLPLKPMEVSWSLDLTSNADFRCVTPSLGEPGWEVLKSDGSRTGTDARWWLEQMFRLGASCALLSVDYADPADHNVCRGLMDDFGDRLWLSPLSQRGNEWGAEGWRRFGGASRFVLPPGMEIEAAEAMPETEAAA